MDIFKAEERNIRNILEKKEIKYTIPRNQRDYVWETKQWKELLVDIYTSISFDENGEIILNDYFIGSCVLSDTKKKNIKSIVDGQQRLTTITIILSVIYDLFEENNQTKLLEGIYSYLLKKDDDGDDYFVIENNALEPYYSEVILNKPIDENDIVPISEQEKRISECYSFFYTNLKSKIAEFEEHEIDYLKAFRSQLLNLKIIEITVGNQIDAYTIFEILNAKGKQLELGDRMKNWILKRLPKQFPTDTAKSKWNKIRESIEPISKSDNNFSNFIKHFWISKYEKLKDEDEIYHYFKTEVSQSEMPNFLKELQESALDYNRIATANRKKINSKLDFVLSSLITFRTSQIRPIALSLFSVYNKNLISEKEITKYLEILEHFHFIYTAICSTPANKVEKIYHKYAPLIRNNFSKKIIYELVEELNSIKPNYNTFKRNFLVKGFSNKNKDLKVNRSIVNYILQKIEYYKQNTDEFAINNLTIEHIANDDGTENTARIGNLLPLSKNINSNCGDEPLKDKIIKYSNSSFIMVNEFIKHNSDKEEWSDKNIGERTTALAKLSYEKVWKLKI
ncbi:DUF262 domain-containing protein [Algibacter pectinivorans]|uniref:Uncharacterized conserved protein, contains ParB-like and HNH nuclease domains n=1 Tax=Algibacter pectinivorans TaxID=870482 RepID=A0A1I1S4Q0_9FLAO|nr:DUF262 domain-containing protein [Algibacter pectinivorans]SFD41469.1 Uncharacterized conserved protein, contains ParB-like and HNH nuclease domains [Algibacter pectinivorans]